MADNFRLTVESEGRTSLRLAIELALNGKNGAPRDGISFYSIDDHYGLVFHRYRPSHGGELFVKLPFGLDLEGLTDFASRWLAAVEYPDEPDIDGDCGRGFLVYTEDWGHVGPWDSALCGIRPVWAMYGK